MTIAGRRGPRSPPSLLPLSPWLTLLLTADQDQEELAEAPHTESSLAGNQRHRPRKQPGLTTMLATKLRSHVPCPATSGTHVQAQTRRRRKTATRRLRLWDGGLEEEEERRMRTRTAIDRFREQGLAGLRINCVVASK